MFTGLVEEIGVIRSLEHKGDGYSITISAGQVIADIHIGDSIAIDGVCLTVTGYNEKSFTVQAVGETVRRSTLAAWQVNMPVNLERAMLAQSRMGGHFVQGHVDGVAQVVTFTHSDAGYWLVIKVPEELHKFLAVKGSLAVNGTSLTIADIKAENVSIAIIPHTAAHTTLKQLKPGDNVNIETDILGKYIYKFLQPYTRKENITLDKLSNYGFD